MNQSMLSHQIKVHQHIFAGPQSRFMMAEQISAHHALLTMETGSFEFEIGDEQGTAFFGDLVFCPAGVNFKRRALSDISFHHIQFELLPAADGMPVFQPPAGKLRISDTERLKSTFNYLRKLQSRRSSLQVQPEYVRNQLVADLLLLCELERLLTDTARQQPDPLMNEAQLLIQRQAFDPEFSLRDTAAQLGLHPSQLTRHFRAAYGLAPAAYMTKLRLEEAKRLLIETNDTLESVATRCGYENGSYFCRVFTEKVGINPSVFRQRNWI
ncbi:AraC-type DNA-binding protein [Paenibacillus sp. UNCCL117]|uniref:helix-turn-helix transcriptional regulator n=1 Tax=unclassified Paenibacillus TaxID=185978 RepID=UPI00087E820D|nr:MULTISPECIES: AraC family transcriptional regulator [unclassified Paenibacillus]SDD57220.1 AraC-type DNA-binding protein [Paenibacillus sp. cl123]SFW51221.1 AraC-type DNA-binding protein [Paenibacillus sp. UNCCL117]